MNKTQFLEYFKKRKLSSSYDTENSVTNVVTFATQNISNAELSPGEDEIENFVKPPSKYEKTIHEKIKRAVGIIYLLFIIYYYLFNVDICYI